MTLIAPAGSRLSFLAGPGRSVGAGPEERAAYRCIGRSCDGATIDVLIERAEPATLTVIGTRSGLPSQAAPLLAARPATARPQYAPDSTIALARLRL